jgi:hypothetical protein
MTISSDQTGEMPPDEVRQPKSPRRSRPAALLGKTVKRSDGVEFKVTEIESKDGWPIVADDTFWAYADEVEVLTAREFRVRWEIDVEATTPREAAEKAHSYQQELTHAVFFHVVDSQSGLAEEIDLAE